MAVCTGAAGGLGDRGRDGGKVMGALNSLLCRRKVLELCFRSFTQLVEHTKEGGGGCEGDLHTVLTVYSETLLIENPK